MEDVKPRGILKNATSVSAGRALLWDEQNLALNEVQKDSTMKITEPKTPYVRYDAETDTVMDLDKIPGFELGELDQSAPITMFDSAPTKEISEITINPRRGSEASEKMVKVDAGALSAVDDSDDELQDEDTREHRKKFAERRNSHYSNEGDAMKAAMKASLLEDEDEDSEVPPMPNLKGK